MVTRSGGTAMRLTMAATMIIGAGSAMTATAATATKHKVKPVCNLVTDASGDAKDVGGTNDPSMDILSADVATNAKYITAVIRVAGLSTGTDSQAASGREWDVAMALPGASNGQLVLGVQTGPFGTRDADNLGGKATLDTAHHQIVITEKLSAIKTFHAHIVSGKTRLSQFRVGAHSIVQLPAVGGLWASTSPLGAPQDDATSNATYLAGSPSCVKPGS
jgi:hypothetical protein